MRGAVGVCRMLVFPLMSMYLGSTTAHAQTYVCQSPQIFQGLTDHRGVDLSIGLWVNLSMPGDPVRTLLAGGATVKLDENIYPQASPWLAPASRSPTHLEAHRQS